MKDLVALNLYTLIFQVFLKPKEGGLVPLLPVVSSLIKDKRAHPDLNIVDMSDDTSPVEGKINRYLSLKV